MESEENVAQGTIVIDPEKLSNDLDLLKGISQRLSDGIDDTNTSINNIIKTFASGDITEGVDQWLKDNFKTDKIVETINEMYDKSKGSVERWDNYLTGWINLDSDLASGEAGGENDNSDTGGDESASNPEPGEDKTENDTGEDPDKKQNPDKDKDSTEDKPKSTDQKEDDNPEEQPHQDRPLDERLQEQKPVIKDSNKDNQNKNINNKSNNETNNNNNKNDGSNYERRELASNYERKADSRLNSTAPINSGNSLLTSDLGKMAVAGGITAAGLGIAGGAIGGAMLLGKVKDYYRFKPKDFKNLYVEDQNNILEDMKITGFDDERIEVFKTSNFKIRASELNEHKKKVEKAYSLDINVKSEFKNIYGYNLFDENDNVDNYLLFVTMIIDGSNSIDDTNFYNIINPYLEDSEVNFIYSGIVMEEYIAKDEEEKEEIEEINQSGNTEALDALEWLKEMEIE